MTDLMFLEDSYLRACDARVTEVTGDGEIVFDRTVFYPTGGGQPHDLGTLTDGNTTWQVTGVKKRAADVLHSFDGEAAPAPGDTLHMEIDWDRRYRLMRTHTAMHVLCGVIFREFGALVTGGNMALDKARMDFELEDLSAERVQRIEDLANDAISRGLAVSWKQIPRDEAFQIPDLIRTKINLLPDFITEVRIVEIEGLDLQADGGTHVRNTAEVGGIQVVGTRSKGRSNKRLEIALIDTE